ncbi:MAG: hypothetical protein R2844_21290 [Caldilineales bacterium]
MTVEYHHRMHRMEILTVRQGVVAGLVGTLALAVVVALGSSATGNGLWTPINAPGAFVTGADAVPAGYAGLLSIAGIVTMFVLGALLGALYATAQEPVDTPSLLIIAVYYGFFIWFIATFVVILFLNPLVQQVWRHWFILAGHLTYGAVLGVAAMLRNPWNKETKEK